MSTLPEGFIVVGPDATREECIAAWVTNLRNPNVRQATTRLCDASGAMCCLGVMEATLGFEVSSETTHPCQEAWQRMGLRTDNGQALDFNLVDLNDVKRLSLPEIADLIKSRPPRLFVDEVPA